MFFIAIQFYWRVFPLHHQPLLWLCEVEFHVRKLSFKIPSRYQLMLQCNYFVAQDNVLLKSFLLKVMQKAKQSRKLIKCHQRMIQLLKFPIFFN